MLTSECVCERNIINCTLRTVGTSEMEKRRRVGSGEEAEGSK